MQPDTNLASNSDADKLFFTPRRSDFGDFLCEIVDFWDRSPDVRAAVEADLQRDGLKRKHLRWRQRQERLHESLPLTGFESESDEVGACSLELGTGRPRMAPMLVFVFMMVRGWLGSLSSKPARTLMLESVSLESLLRERNCGVDTLPPATTILDNVNALEESTLRLAHRCFLADVAAEGLDDFSKGLIDSTSVEASSCFPSESKMLYRLPERAVRLSRKLDEYGLESMECKVVMRWLEQVRVLDFQINLVGDKVGAKKKRRKAYRELYYVTCKLLGKLLGRLRRNLELFRSMRQGMGALRRECVEALLDQIGEDLTHACRTMEQSMRRIEDEINTPTREKILSLADRSAAMIVKGGREPVLGYKPQLARSGNGFVTALHLDQGNGNDSHALEPVVRQCLENTGLPLKSLSVDDGYAWAQGIAEVKKLGVETISISGAKGRKILGEEVWEDETYRQLRADRSAVESLMFVLKYCFHFGRMSRRELDCVRCEMLEKTLAYNFARAVYLRDKTKRPPGETKAA